ncbi:MAG: phosphoribosyltransferase [Cyanobacteria bacterium PR.3.49]|nr:phosphoribosyltransferase [Cyanobacteria bacterium PR.3.49]
MFFNDRVDAGKKLALKLEQYASSLLEKAKQSEVLVVGLPRGGVPVALEVARRFKCPLEIIVAKKLPFPNQPEYAIGAVSSGGIVVLSPDIPQSKSWREYIEQQKRQLLATTQRREDEFYVLAGRHRSSFEDKIVIIVDDGVATGMTAMAAIEAARQRGARSVILAAPVMSRESFNQLQLICDDVVAAYRPEVFNAVAEHYLEFLPTSNDEVVKALAESNGFHNGPSLARTDGDKKTS